MMTAMAVITVLVGVVLIESLIMARQEVSKLRDIVDQWAEEQHAETDTDEEWASGWAKMK